MTSSLFIDCILAASTGSESFTIRAYRVSISFYFLAF